SLPSSCAHEMKVLWLNAGALDLMDPTRIAECHPLWQAHAKLGSHNRLQLRYCKPVLSSAGNLLGAVAVYYRRGHPPDGTDLELVEHAGHLAAIAIEHRQVSDQLFFQARHDILTGLPNRLLFHDRLHQLLLHAQRYRRQFAVLMVDVDRFKQINDTL